jgi:hypothetical protein
MPAEILGKPPPTPHPDESAKAASHREPESAPPPGLPLSSQETDPDGQTNDSCFDDLDVMLAQPITEPDPALLSRSSAEEGSRAPKKTAEVFETAGSLFGMGGPARAKGRGVFSSVLNSMFRGPKRASQAASAAGGRSGQALEAGLKSGDSATPDSDLLAESRMNWFLLLVLSYASAVSLALGWVLWTGRTLRALEPATTETRQASVESHTSPVEHVKPVPLPPVPPENQTTLGQSIRIGELEITPIAVNSAPVELVGMIEPFDYRREDTDSLLLRLRITNVSRQHPITPLDRMLIRDQASPLDRSLIVTSGKYPIGLFPLAIDSEWLIQGQAFPELKPGETAETLIASEAITDDRLAGEMSWRVRLRTGPYRTDVLALRFTKDDVMP